MIRRERREEKDWNSRSKDVWGRDILNGFTGEMAQDVKIFVLDVDNAHQCTYAMEKTLNSQLARMT